MELTQHPLSAALQNENAELHMKLNKQRHPVQMIDIIRDRRAA